MGAATAVRIERAELHAVALPLLRPFEAAHGTERVKHCLVLRLDCEGVSGWGECVAMSGPWYSEETTVTAWHILTEYMLPSVLGRELSSAGELLGLVAPVRGNNMARAALEGAFLDALARARGVSLSRLLGGVRSEIDSGVSIGMQRSPAELASAVERELRAGYKRAKLKIGPGADVEYVREVRRRLPDAALMVDANSAYSLHDAQRLEALDAYDLMMIEQPLAYDDIVDHAALARRLRTPICLDESIRSAEDARKALDLGSCRVINVKPGRLGGLTESVRTHDLCRERGVPVWCGGMLETNIGRAHNVTLASLPGFTLPGDVSASDRYFARDIAFPNFELTPRGAIALPDSPGIGVEVDERRLGEVTLRREEFRAGRLIPE